MSTFGFGDTDDARATGPVASLVFLVLALSAIIFLLISLDFMEINFLDMLVLIYKKMRLRKILEIKR